MSGHYPSVAARAGHRCEYCRAPEGIFNFAFEVEHVVPTSRGGSDGEENLALACRSCNLFKSDHLTGTDPESAGEVALFHPRQQRWEDHFQADPETGSIQGLSATGRATLVRLQINSAAQQAARRLWMRLGLFP
jgi:hypothetical protein